MNMMNVEEEQGGDHLFTIFTDRANLGPDRCKKYKKGKKGKKGKKEKKERVSKMLCDIRMMTEDADGRVSTCFWHHLRAFCTCPPAFRLQSVFRWTMTGLQELHTPINPPTSHCWHVFNIITPDIPHAT